MIGNCKERTRRFHALGVSSKPLGVSSKPKVLDVNLNLINPISIKIKKRAYLSDSVFNVDPTFIANGPGPALRTGRVRFVRSSNRLVRGLFY